MSYACLSFIVESDILQFWTVQRKGSNVLLLKMVMKYNWTMHFGVRYVLDYYTKILHYSLRLLCAVLVLFTAQKLQKSSAVSFILLSLIQTSESSCYCTSLYIFEDEILFKLQIISFKDRKKNIGLGKTSVIQGTLHLCVTQELVLHMCILLGSGGGRVVGGKNVLLSLIK